MAVFLVTRENAAEGEKPRMIEARTGVSAVAYAARSTFKASSLTTKEALQWAKKGIELEEPNAEE